MAANFRTVLEAGADDPWIVMVHGMSQDHRVFSAQVDAFKDRYRILLIDLPGHGLSAGVPGPFGHIELASHVAGAIDDAGVSRCDYWATHTGTSLGLLIASAEPDRFRSIILEGAVVPGHTMPIVDVELRRARNVAQTLGVAEACRQWFYETGWFEVMRRRPEECRADAHRAIVSGFSGAPWLYTGQAATVEPIDGQLASIDVPVLLYNGEHDLRDFVEAADLLEGLLPRVTRATIPDAGGFPAWEFPQRVNRLVADFLSSASAASNGR
ncbi:MAG: alpha/beta fold hydrolase [Proteobacteria bacterium]|nr:alpha/beta fold hydrolase [Pseudomonadota bacterium]